MKMMRLALVLVSAIGFLGQADAQISGPTPSASPAPTNPGPGVPHMGLYCVDANGNDNICPFSQNSAGSDFSGAAPAVGNVLATFNVTVPGGYYVQNQSNATLQVVFDNGPSTPVSIQLLSPGGVGLQGSDTTPPIPWFVGRIRVAGPAGSQFMARRP